MAAGCSVLALGVVAWAVWNPWHVAAASAMGWLAAAVFVLLAAVTAAFGLPVGLRRVLVCGLGVPAGALAALTAQSVGLVPGSAAPLVLGVVLAVAFAALGAVVPRRALTAIVAGVGVVLAGLVTLAWIFLEVANGGRIIARIAAPDGRHEAVVIEGDGLGVGTRPDVHVRTRGGWLVRDTLLWRGHDESPRPRDVRFTTPEQIEIIDYRGCRYLVGFSTQTLNPHSPTTEPLTPACAGD